MMNLGTFAGGVVQGMEGAQRAQLAKEELKMRQAESSMRQEEAAARKMERERQQAMRDENAKAWNAIFAPQEVVEEVPTKDAAGNIVKMPQKKMVAPDPATDTNRAMRYYVETMKNAIKFGNVDPEQLSSMMERMSKAQKTEAGQMFTRAIYAGDEKAKDAIVKQLGRDPAGSKLVRDPLKGVIEIQFADGSPPVDLKSAAMTLAGIEYYNSHMRQPELDAATLAEKKGNIARDEAAVAESKARVEKLIPAQARASDASANAGNATAGAQRALADKRRAEAAAGPVNPKVSKEIAATLNRNEGYKVLGMTSPGAANVVQRAAERMANSGASAQDAATAAMTEFSNLVAAARTNPKVKAKGYTPESAAEALMRRKYGSAATTQASSDEE